MNISPKLNLNKHPKDNANGSLVKAHNIKVSDDESCLVNENSIFINDFIHNYLTTFYTSSEYRIVGVIPCNTELIILVNIETSPKEVDIFRYRELGVDQTESMYCAYGGIGSTNRFYYSGGTLRGAFTYNVENSLIVCITEYDGLDKYIPLRTINLGNFDDQSVTNDRNIPNAKLSITPEVRLPEVRTHQYFPGTAYKGWYYMYIRYKINTVDYTQWYSIGHPIYIDSIEQFQIIRYCYNRETRLSQEGPSTIAYPTHPDDGFGAGCSDHFSDSTDIAKETFKTDIVFPLDLDYTKYQIGLICSSKTYNKAFRTSDITITEDDIGFNNITKEFVLDNKTLIDYSAESLIIDNYNYFNVKKVINYQNRIYISNYVEDNFNNKDIDKALVNNITTRLSYSSINDFGLVYDTALINVNSLANQYDTGRMTLIRMYNYLGVTKDTIITVTDGTITKIDKADHFYISSDNITPGWAFVEHRGEGSLGTVIYTYFGKDSIKNVVVTINDQLTDTNKSVINTRGTVINGGMLHINTDINFDKRKTESTLIPGEVYNFFIHYVNKYGHATNGYKLTNNNKFTVEGSDIEIVIVPFKVKNGEVTATLYATFPLDNNIAIESFEVNGFVINTQNVEIYRNVVDNNGNTYVNDKVEDAPFLAALELFKNQYSSYATIKYVDTKWYQVSYGVGRANFQVYVNDNGDRLFKVPFPKNYEIALDGFPNSIEDYQYYNKHIIIRAIFNNIVIPEGYDGYYISYEKFEPIQRATGVLTRNDFRSQDLINVDGNIVSRITANDYKSDRMMFYSGIFDISDTLKLDYNVMRVEAVNVFKTNDIPEWDYFQRNKGFNYVHDCNKPQMDEYGGDLTITYAMPEYKLAVGDASVDNRMGVGTGLEIKDSYNLFPAYNASIGANNKIKLYRVTLLNATRSLYISDSKTLIKLSNVKYRNPNLPIDNPYSTNVIENGYNGHYTFDGVLVYENAGISFNTSDNKVRGIMHNVEYYKSNVEQATPHTYQNDIPFVAYFQFPLCSDVIFESKSFKNEPSPIVYLMKSAEGDNKFATGNMVIPKNSIDLFQNKQGSQDQFYPKTYANFRDDLVSIEEFDKTIRRSNVIQDESKVNNWRVFPIEGYKNITENKGKITNLVGIGTMLLAHTEHSLFMFDTNNTLRTLDKEVQLTQPDAFEVSYKEVFTSDLGFGGLQDRDSYVVDDFGYIFYSNDKTRIYRFDNGALNYIDDDVIHWLRKYKPYNIRFANDKINNRIVIKFNYLVNLIEQEIILSYNYNTKSFISIHDYTFNYGYNTKNRLYLQYVDNTGLITLHEYDRTGTSYGSFDNIKNGTRLNTIIRSSLSVIINVEFESVKYLEYITYKLSKYIDDTTKDSTKYPVEEFKVPYSGNVLSVYNDMINTGDLDILIDVESAKNVFDRVDKPYWDLGLWNFNYLRNKISERNNLIDDTMSRLFGNYFIVELTVDNSDTKRVEFEDVQCKLIKT